VGKLISGIIILILVTVCSQTSVAIPFSDRSALAIKQATVRLTPRLNAKEMSLGQPVFIRIFKEEAELELWLESDGKYQLFQTWPIAKFSGDLGPKTKQGDHQAPEGFYFVTPEMLNPYSDFHLSFNLGYPNRYERSHGYTGSALMVHGDNVSIGCYAMTNLVIEEIWTLIGAALDAGQPFFRVHSFPFRMTPENMVKHSNKKWADFWLNLKQGYDHFEQNGSPPNVEVRSRRYIFD